MVQNIRKLLHPSMRAASSTSIGTFFMAPTVIKMLIGRVKAQNATARPHRLLVMCRVFATLAKGIMMA